MLNVKMGESQSMDAAVAARELFNAINQPDISFALFYCSSEYDLSALGAELNRYFSHIDLIGCTSGGEISTAGYKSGTLIGLSISSPGFIAVSERIDHLSDFQLAQGEEIVLTLTKKLAALGKMPNPDNTFGFLLIDGMSAREEIVAYALYRNLINIHLFGGSAADGYRVQETHIYHEGAFHSNSAIFTLFHTTYPFTVFKFNHFEVKGEKMIVTKADVERGIVLELNGIPAAREYMRIMDLEEDELTTTLLSMHPVVVSVGSENFVRSVIKVNEDESLSFACAIDEGIVLSIACAGDLIENLISSVERIHREIESPQLILGCDCFGRMVEMEQKNIKEEVGEILARNNVFGFTTYGEQYNGMHMNQTFTGVAIGT